MYEEYNEALELESIKNKLKKYPKLVVLNLINEMYAEEETGTAEKLEENITSNEPSPEGDELSSNSQEA